MRGGARGGAALALIAALGVLLGGCELLGPAFGGPFGGDPFPSSSPIASYTSGKATIAITGGETIVLDRLGHGATVDSLFGSDVSWTGSSGWHVRVNGAGASDAGAFGGAAGFSGYVAFDRIADGAHWTTLGGDDRCIVDVTVVSAATLRGTASCKGVEWYDALDLPTRPDGPKPLDEPKFDAEVTFEATR